METVGFYVDSESKLSKVEILRGLVTDKLTTAVREILAVVERTVAGYESEVSALNRELDRHKALLQPRVRLHRTDLDNAGGQDPVDPVSADKSEEDSGPENKNTETKDHQISEISTGNTETEEFQQEMVPVDSSVSCPATEERHSDCQINNTQSSRSKRRKRLPRRYRSNDTDADDGEDNRENEWTPDDKQKSQSLKVKKKHQIKLRIGLLLNCSDVELSNKVFRLAGPLQTIMCSRDLSESDFFNQLRSSFPELRENKPFQAFLADSSKRLLPVQINTMTPTELYTAFRSTEGRQFAFYIQIKEQKDTWTNAQTSCDEKTPSTSGLVEEGTTQTSSAAQSEEDDGDGSDDWKPEQNDEEELSGASKSKTWITGRYYKKRSLSSEKRSDTFDACKVCGVFFRTKSILVKHAWSHVENPGGLCGVCGEQLTSSEELRSHLDTHQKLHRCDTCGQFFVLIKRHMATHTNDTEKEFKCPICQKTFAQEKLLKKHELDHKEKTYKCESCPKWFMSKVQLDNHSKTHTGERPFCCDVCGKCVTDFRSLSRHKQIHSGRKEYSCKHCGKQFLYLTHVQQHEKIHTHREKNFLCDICSKTFHTKFSLRIHQKMHEGKHIVKCTVCNKLLKGNLRSHMRTHTEEKPFVCPECGWKFRSKAHLKNHVRTHQGDKPFTCKVCGKACGRKWYLDVHMRTHTGEKPYRCSLCDKAFSQSHCLKTHMKSHHGAVD